MAAIQVGPIQRAVLAKIIDAIADLLKIVLPRRVA